MTSAPARPPLTVAAIGPSQQGKSTLACALSKVLATRGGGQAIDYRELTRGGNYRRDGAVETRAARWLEITTETRRVAHLDLAGRCSRAITQLAPLSWAEAILLVVSPASGAPATDLRLVELLRVAAHHGVEQAIIFVNRCDRDDDPELIDLAELEARALLDACGLAGDEAPVIRGAALPALLGDPRWTPSILELAEAIDRRLVAPARDPDAPLRSSVLRGFRIAGRGAVATTRIERGSLRVGDPIDVLGTSHHRWIAAEERVIHLRRAARSLRAFGRAIDTARPGELVGVLLPSPGGWRDAYRVSRGLTIAAPDTIALHRGLIARVRILAPAEGGWPRDLEETFVGQAVIGTACEAAAIQALGARPRPGEVTPLRIELGYPIALAGGERVIVRRQGRLIGLGVVLEPQGPPEPIAIDTGEGG